MFRRLRAGSGALWRPWYDGGRRGDRELAQLRCVVVFCVSIIRKLLPRGKTAREQFIPPVARFVFLEQLNNYGFGRERKTPAP